LLLPLLLLTFREPKRRGLLRAESQGAAPAAPLKPPLSEVLRYLWRNKNFYGPHFFAMALLAMAGYSAAAWLPEALVRVYPVTAGQAGKYIGVSVIVMNSSGMLLAGLLCDRLTRGGSKDAPIIVALISACGIGTLSCFPSLMPTISWVWIALFAQGITFNAYNAVGPMAVNQVTPNQFRAQVSAVYLFVVNALGLGVGPALVPFLNEHLFHDPVKLRYSLVIVVFSSAAMAVTLLLIERPVYRQKHIESAAWQ
jgi:MFS family permease